MVWGNLIVKSRKREKIVEFLDEVDAEIPRLESCTLPETADGLFLSIMGVDSEFVYACWECGEDKFPGLGQGCTYDADERKFMCSECSTRDVFETLVFLYKEGRRIQAIRETHMVPA